MPKFYWTPDEGSFVAFDKFCHVLLHCGIVKLLRLLGVDPTVAFLMSQTFGWFYEWYFDCYLYGIIGRFKMLQKFNIDITGASKKDIIANNLGAIIGMIL
jgi:hypothetical protein